MANGSNLRIFTQLAATIAGALVQQPNIPVRPSDIPMVKETVAEVLANDPVLLNEVNGEAPLQSRVTIGNAIAAVGVVAGLFGFQLSPDTYQTIVQGATAAFTLGGIGYSMYGRWRKGLKPLGV